MSPRLKTIRRVMSPPAVKGFKPYGLKSEKQEKEKVKLLLEEYEAIRLSDYDGYNHHQASEIMKVSRPTFTRIYASALQKIAKALVEGKQVSIEGGKVYFDSDWYNCSECSCYFNNPKKDESIKNCPLCGSVKTSRYEIQSDNEQKEKNNEDFCICPNCGYEAKHQHGYPCNQSKCPECGENMRRRR